MRAPEINPGTSDGTAPENARATPDKSDDLSRRDQRVRRRRSVFRTPSLPLKIIALNLLALNVLVGGILYFNASREGMANQWSKSLVMQAELVANLFESRWLRPGTTGLNIAAEPDISAVIAQIKLDRQVEILVFNRSGILIGQSHSDAGDTSTNQLVANLRGDPPCCVPIQPGPAAAKIGKPMQVARENLLTELVGLALSGQTVVRVTDEILDATELIVGTPVKRSDRVFGAIILVSTSGEIESLFYTERKRILQMFVVATVVSIGMSLILASTISQPIADLAEAAELGRDGDPRNETQGRIRIPDLTARPDEIGRLSGALRGMVAALYDRIEANEEFAADVAHEIKNPLASLRSAVGSLRLVKNESDQKKLFDVIDHDVRRLDRLVSDISDASRLDSELVKEDQTRFNLLELLTNLSSYMVKQAKDKGVEFITDLPDQPIAILGLEERLAQVFVNLIANAVSFCDEGDAVRVWARRRDNRVLIVVEDTGPGIPEEALMKIFDRFYSHRDQCDFGNNSGLGLAISKQIVEAHDGVIWAENIRPTKADITSEPLGARFIVGLPV